LNFAHNDILEGRREKRQVEQTGVRTLPITGDDDSIRHMFLCALTFESETEK